MLLGIILAIILFIWAQPTTFLLGARGPSEDLSSPASHYLRGLVLGLPFSFLAGYLVPFMQLEGDGKQAVYAAATIFVIDVLCDLLNVFVLG